MPPDTQVASALDATFAGRAVVVTGVGAAGQVGETVARAFAERGAIVHCIGRSASVHERVRELVSAGLRARGHVCDLTNVAETRRVADVVAGEHDGAIVALAALAGGFSATGPVAESEPQVLAGQIAINATTAYTTACAFVPALRRGRGAMVFVAAAAVVPGARVAGIAAYAMSKGAVVQLVRALAQEEREHGVRVNAIAPTAIRTAANLATLSPKTRYVEREDVARCIVALAEPGFARVTGQVVQLD